MTMSFARGGHFSFMLTAPSARLPVPVALAVVGLLGGIGALRRMPRIGNEEPDVAAWLNLNAGLDPVNDPSVRSKFYDNWFSGPQINYHNQGYYEFDGPCDTTFYASPTAEKADACGENMARKLATFVNLGPEDTLVDIAVGQGMCAHGNSNPAALRSDRCHVPWP